MNCHEVFICVRANVNLYNVVFMGVSFLFLFTAFNTTAFTSKNVITSVTSQTNGTFQGDAYLSSAIIYVSLAAANWIAPIIMTFVGVKPSLIIGSVPYCLYVASFIYPMEWLLYLTSVLIGMGAALLWTAQGVMLTQCSDEKTMSRNTAIFWLLFQSSLLVGNLIEFVLLQGETDFDPSTRIVLFVVLTTICCVGTLLLFPLRRLPNIPVTQSFSMSECGLICRRAADTFVNCWNLLKTRNMLVLSFVFAYSGLSNAYRGGIFPACVGQNLNFEDPKAMIGVVGFTVGAAEVIGSAIMMAFGSRIVKFGRDPLIVTCFVLHCVAYALSYLNFPDSCPIGESAGYVVINSRIIAIIVAFLLGIGDALLVNANFSILGKLYSGKLAPPAFALAVFMQSLASAIAFFYAGLFLKYQLIILLAMNLACLISFVVVEFATVRQNNHSVVVDGVLTSVGSLADLPAVDKPQVLTHSQTVESFLSVKSSE